MIAHNTRNLVLRVGPARCAVALHPQSLAARFRVLFHHELGEIIGRDEEMRSTATEAPQAVPVGN